jgi:hypothetical protein
MDILVVRPGIDLGLIYGQLLAVFLENSRPAWIIGRQRARKGEPGTSQQDTKRQYKRMGRAFMVCLLDEGEKWWIIFTENTSNVSVDHPERPELPGLRGSRWNFLHDAVCLLSLSASVIPVSLAAAGV